MKKKSLKKFQHSSYIPQKDSEGNVIEKYDDVLHDGKAFIWPATSKVQAQMYGLQINDVLNMHWYERKFDIQVHDLIIHEGIRYKVESIKVYHRFNAMEIKRL